MADEEAIYDIMAIFSNAEDAQQAEALVTEQAMGEPNSARISAERVLHVKSRQCRFERISEALRSLGANEIKISERPRESGWMGHHYGRVTGSAVTPGEGDAEAGSS